MSNNSKTVAEILGQLDELKANVNDIENLMYGANDLISEISEKLDEIEDEAEEDE